VSETVDILLADDSDVGRYVIATTLRRAGFTVREVADGTTALQEVLARPPDLAVLDVMMPGVSGLDAIRAIRADPALADLPVILLTARAQESDVETGFDSGADDYITKPFSPRELASRVQALLTRSG
jgi:two-component system, OmpR family, response regulator MtrA